MELKLAHKKKKNKTRKTTLVAHRPTAVETVSRFRSIDRLKGSHYQLLTVWKFFQVSGSWEKWEREKAVYRSPEISFQLVFKPKLKLVPLSKQSVLKSQPWTENSIEVTDIPLIIGYICTHTHTHTHTHTCTHNAHTHTCTHTRTSHQILMHSITYVHVYRKLRRQGISWYGCFIERLVDRKIFEKAIDDISEVARDSLKEALQTRVTLTGLTNEITHRQINLTQVVRTSLANGRKVPLPNSPANNSVSC